MSDSTKNIKELRGVIKNEVFITKDQERFVSRKGNQTNWVFDFRRILLDPHHLNLVAEIFWNKYEDKYPFQVGGLEVAAIPFVSAIVMKSVEKGKPVNGFFIRKSRKKDGLLRMIEGKMTNDPIILVDDIINSGKTFIRQLEVVEGLGKSVKEIFAILRFRDNEYYDFARQRNIPIASLFTLPDFGIKLLERKEPKPQYQPFEVKWYFKSENPNFFYVVPKSAPTLDAARVYFGSDSGNFWALNQEDGSVAWKYKVGWHAKGKSIFSTPAVCRDIVYFGSYDGNVYALDAQTGKKKWIFMEADWVGSSPAVSEDLETLFIGLEFGLFNKKGGIVALDLATGKKKWEYTMPELTHGSPTYSPKKKVVAIGSNDGVAYLFNAKSGKLLWKQQTGGEIKGAPVFDEKRGYAIFGSHDGGIRIFDSSSGKLLHNHKAEFAIYSIPLVTEKYLYVASLDKRIYCIDLDTFEEKWVFLTGARVFSSPVLINNKIYVGSNNARLYELDAETGKELGFFQVTERITNRIAYNSETKRFFLPTFANEMYCLERKEDLPHETDGA